MRKLLILLAGLAVAGCSTPQVTGHLMLPDADHTRVDYAGQVIELSPMNNVLVLATKTPDRPAQVFMEPGTSISANALQFGAAGLAATAFILPLCLAGNC